mmetsp:Transcript_27262/g.80176  ORF Transcript_27262/g.80176 Transcript_27262/m.80176 type:complete len:208 (-) Transcript_27262:727-1350(-)
MMISRLPERLVRGARSLCGNGVLSSLDEVGHVHGHLLDVRVVELLDLAEGAHVLRSHEVDGDTLAAEAARAADAVDVVLAVGRQVVVDDERDLLHVDAARQEVSCDEHAARPRAELAHDELALLLVHVRVHGGAGEIAGVHALREPLHLPPRVGEDDRLGDGERLVEVTERVQLPVLTLHHHVELLNAVEGELVALDEDPHGVAHEL